MDFTTKLFSLFGLIFILFVVQYQCHPTEEANSVANVSDGEMMETAESQNPFLPRFAMRRLKERREKARAQRRNYQPRRSYQPMRSQVRCSHYKK